LHITITTMLRRSYTLLQVLLLAMSTVTPAAFQSSPSAPHFRRNSVLFAVRPAATLKAASSPLMDAGKAMARSGELIIDTTNELENYGGALSAAGAFIRNAGDCVAQAAASCRFKTGAELVCDELREAATCLAEGADKMTQAVTEASVDNQNTQQSLQDLCKPMARAGAALEAAGRSIMQGATVPQIGEHFVAAGVELEQISKLVGVLVPTSETCVLAAQRMNYGAEKMKDAGYELTGKRPEVDSVPKGKSWIKS
jgi:hypothetical protein